jgi:putative chitinase
MPIITASLLSTVLPKCQSPAVWASVLNPACEKYAINTRDRVAAFWAQTGYESASFNCLQEDLNYSSSLRLMKVWPKRFPTEALAQLYIQNPEKLANYVYQKRLGNGDAASGDGFRYLGRGIIQITGRSNYAALSKVLAFDFVQEPERLLEPKWAALSAAWFWASNGLNALADDETGDDDLEDFSQITKRINGGTTGIQARFALFKKMIVAI